MVAKISESDAPQPEYEDKIRKISIDSLSSGVSNVRTDPGDVKDLAESIKIRGLEHPILVRAAPNNPGMFEVIAGSRRLAAVRELGWKRIDSRVVNCDDITALSLSLDENQKRGDLTAREVGETINRMMSLYQGDPGEGNVILRWVARQLNWMNESGGKDYPDIRRVRKALQDAEFQRLVPNITIKVRNRGDIRNATAPLTVAREVMPILNDPKVSDKLNKLPPEQGQTIREEFLNAYAKEDPRRRGNLKELFIADPNRPIQEHINSVERERRLLVMISARVPYELLERIDDHKKTSGMKDWKRSDAIKDLVEKGLKTVGL